MRFELTTYGFLKLYRKRSYKTVALTRLSYRPTLRQPGIEPGTQPWQGRIIPFNHWRILVYSKILFQSCDFISFSSSVSSLKLLFNLSWSDTVILFISPQSIFKSLSFSIIPLLLSLL